MGSTPRLPGSGLPFLPDLILSLTWLTFSAVCGVALITMAAANGLLGLVVLIGGGYYFIIYSMRLEHKLWGDNLPWLLRCWLSGTAVGLYCAFMTPELTICVGVWVLFAQVAGFAKLPGAHSSDTNHGDNDDVDTR